jgi:hypothetical protein
MRLAKSSYRQRLDRWQCRPDLLKLLQTPLKHHQLLAQMPRCLTGLLERHRRQHHRCQPKHQSQQHTQRKKTHHRCYPFDTAAINTALRLLPRS